MECTEERIAYIRSKPVIIWGTKAAAKICYFLLKKIGANIVAVGNNHDLDDHKKYLYEIPVLPLQHILDMYQEALVVIGSFSRSTSDVIITQMNSYGNRFSVCRFEEIEYLYELVYLERDVKDKEKLFSIINNVSYDEAHTWKKNINKNIISEYRYVVQDDKAEDLKEKLKCIYGIKKLLLIISADKVKKSEGLIDELARCDSIGHIVAVINYDGSISQDDLKILVEKVFYIICDENVSVELLTDLEKNGVAVDIKKVSNELFELRKNVKQYDITEKSIVESVLAYIGETNERILHRESLGAESVYVVQLHSGLANQMLIYLFGRFIENESGRSVVFDDTVLELDRNDEEANVSRVFKWHKGMTYDDVKEGVKITREKNSYYKFDRAEVAEVFDIPIRLLSDYFDKETWKSYLEKIKEEHSYKYGQSYPLCQVLIENGIDMMIIRDTIMSDEFLALKNCCYIDTYSWGRPYAEKSITSFMLNCSNAYFIGVWATGRADDWFIHNRQWIKRLFKFRLHINERNESYIREINRSDSVMVHIRRGDFAYFKIAADAEYFRRAIEQVETTTLYQKRKYFIFSDDLEWCYEHKNELGIEQLNDNVIFVSGNTGTDSYMDLYLMSLGRIIIATPGSTFSYIAILLSESVEKHINIPRYIYELTQGTDAVPQLVDVQYE